MFLGRGVWRCEDVVVQDHCLGDVLAEIGGSGCGVEFDVEAVAFDGILHASSERFGQAGEETVILPMIKVVKDVTSCNIGQPGVC